jgi:hypothetical protein
MAGVGGEDLIQGRLRRFHSLEESRQRIFPLFCLWLLEQHLLLPKKKEEQ